MSTKVRIHFHFRSPYSRIGLQKIAASGIADKVDVRPILLTRAAGEDQPINPTRTPQRRRYLMQDVPRATAEAALPISFPTPFDPDYRPAFGAFFAAREAGEGLKFAATLSNLRWGEGADISKEETLSRAFEMCGLAGLTPADDIDDLIEKDAEIGAEDGAFGVPFGVIDNGEQKELFFGQDRFDLLIARCG